LSKHVPRIEPAIVRKDKEEVITEHGILKGEVPLASSLTGLNKSVLQIKKLSVVIQLIPKKQSNRRSTIQ
jgi:hypothetical protein